MAASKTVTFRAEVIGSFLRPPTIKQARQRLAEGQITKDELRAIEDHEIEAIVALQESVGLKVATDGEFRRSTYSENFTTSGISGIKAEYVGTGDFAYSDGKGGTRTARVPQVVDKIRWLGSRNATDFAFLAKTVKTATPKITLPGPCYIYQRSGRHNISRDVYPNIADFWADLTAAYHAEINALYEAGCRYLQFDETSMAKLGDPKIQHGLEARGDDWQELLSVYTSAINAVLAGVPADMAVGVHLCRGNQAGHWQAAGGYDPVAKALFQNVNASRYFLEYDSPRAGTFEPLRMLPDGKSVVLGLVSTKTAVLEDAEAVEARVREAAKIVPLARLGLSPQCGFASSVTGNPLSFEEQRAKLELIVAVARRVWPDA